MSYFYHWKFKKIKTKLFTVLLQPWANGTKPHQVPIYKGGLTKGTPLSPPKQNAKNNRLRDRQEEVGSHSNFGLVANWASQQPPSVYKRLVIRRRKESVLPPFFKGLQRLLWVWWGPMGGKGGSSLLTFKKV